MPVLTAIQLGAGHAGWAFTHADAYLLIVWLWRINLALLVFNILPIYPLDGGQILRALLWFPLGQVRSLFVAAGIGFAGGIALLLFAFVSHSIWIGIMALFLISQASYGWKAARYLDAEAAASAPEKIPADKPVI